MGFKLKNRKLTGFLLIFAYCVTALVITQQVDVALASLLGTSYLVYVGGNVKQKQILKE